jgi:beta-lactam-binding protein with PASTA domain
LNAHYRIAARTLAVLTLSLPLHTAHGQGGRRGDTARAKVLTKFVGPAAVQGRTVLTFPAPGCSDTARLIRVIGNVTFVPKSVPMPQLTGMPVQAALAALDRLKFGARIRRMRGRYPTETVLSQAPPRGTPTMTGDTVVVCWRLPERWPSLVGLTFDEATRALTDSGYGGIRQERVTVADSVGLIVAQEPLAGTSADSGGIDTVFVGVPLQNPPAQDTVRTPARPDTVRKRPGRDSVLVPNLTGLTSRTAADSLKRLRLEIITRMVNAGDPQPGQLVVDSQVPVAMARVPVGTAVTLILLAKGGHTPWPLIIVALILLATGATILRSRARRPLHAMHTVSHVDAGLQRLKATGVHDPAESKLAMLGFSVTVTADPGIQHLRIHKPPPPRDEHTDD